MKRYDLIISGGGMIGSIAAVAASQKGLSVLLIESGKNSMLGEESERDLRVSAISWENISFLKSLGIFPLLLQKRIQPYSHMKVWDSRSHAKIKFDADFSRQSCLGYLMENNNLVQAAWKKSEYYESCDRIQQNSIIEIENNGLQIRVRLADGREFKSRALISAEGRKSKIRALAGIQTQELSYEQSGLVANISIENADSETAYQSFNTGGPIGVLPVGFKQFSIVWSLPSDEVGYWLNCDKAIFEKGVSEALPDSGFESITLKSPRAAFPLSQLYAEKYFEKRIILCGDSAHGVHPLAGQGVNLGIGDIQLLFDVLDIEALKSDELLFQRLRKYQRRRISQVRETSEMMSFLHYIFKDDKHIKRPFRSLGMNLLNRSTLKKWFISQAGS